MENTSANFFDEALRYQEHSLDSIIQEIAEFNKDYGFIETFSDSIHYRVNSVLNEDMDDKSFDEEREFRVEKILEFNEILIDMWLEVYSYRWEEFYEDNKISAKWNKIWLFIADKDIFIDFVNKLPEELNNRLFTFLYTVSIDSLKKSDFYRWKKFDEEKILEIIDMVWIMNTCDRVCSSEMRWLMEDYQNLSLYQSLLSKMTIIQMYNNVYIDSLKQLDEYEYLENLLIDWFWALDMIQQSQSVWMHHKKHEYLLAEVLRDCLNHLHNIAYEETIHDKKMHDKNPEYPIFQNIFHQWFIVNFFREYTKRKNILSQTFW